MAHPVPPYLASISPWAVLLTSLVIGCAGRSPLDNGSAALPEVDAQPPDVGPPKADVTIDAATVDATERPDVLAPPVPPNEPDAGCGCTPDDGGWTGFGVVETLGCFCAWPHACLDYAAAVTSCRSWANDRLEVYGACNLEVIRLPGTYDAGTTLVYDATTHELVGGSYASDYPAFSCGSASVIGRKAGVFPTGCTITRSAPLCSPDAG